MESREESPTKNKPDERKEKELKLENTKETELENGQLSFPFMTVVAKVGEE